MGCPRAADFHVYHPDRKKITFLSELLLWYNLKENVDWFLSK